MTSRWSPPPRRPARLRGGRRSGRTVLGRLVGQLTLLGVRRRSCSRARSGSTTSGRRSAASPRSARPDGRRPRSCARCGVASRRTAAARCCWRTATSSPTRPRSRADHRPAREHGHPRRRPAAADGVSACRPAAAADRRRHAYHPVRRPNATFLGVLRVAQPEIAALVAASPTASPSCRRRAARVAGGAGAQGRALAAGSFALGSTGGRVAATTSPPPTTPMSRRRTTSTLRPRGSPARSSTARQPAGGGAARHRLAAAAGLVRSGAPVGSVYLRHLFWSRPLSAAAVRRTEQRIGALDEDRLLLDSAVKGADGLLHHVLRSARLALPSHAGRARPGLPPNHVTLASLVIGILAAAAFGRRRALGARGRAVCCCRSLHDRLRDGQLARYTRQFSKFRRVAGLDARPHEGYLVFAGLAIGASRAGDPVWLLACSALVLQSVRHTSDFSHAFVQRRAPRGSASRRSSSRWTTSGRRRAPDHDRRAAAAPLVSPRASCLLWARLDDVRVARWLKRMAAFPIGERFAFTRSPPPCSPPGHVHRAAGVGRLRRPLTPRAAGSCGRCDEHRRRARPPARVPRTAPRPARWRASSARACRFPGRRCGPPGWWPLLTVAGFAGGDVSLPVTAARCWRGRCSGQRIPRTTARNGAWAEPPLVR